MNNDAQKTEDLRDIVNLLLNDSLLLTPEEKQEFIYLTPILSYQELLDLFKLLMGSKENTENILDALEKEYPDVVKDLSDYQKKLLNTIFKEERTNLKIKITN